MKEGVVPLPLRSSGPSAGKPWRVIVAGSRDAGFSDCFYAFATFAPVLDCATEIVSGACRYGADYFGERWARNKGVTVTLFPADWNAHGRAAGPIRNRKMAEYADVLVAVWDGKSAGTKNMIDEMQRAQKPVWIWRISASAAKPAEPRDAEQGPL